jgi:hypothetical protein
MVGCAVNAGYRRDLNFLSDHDYTLSPACYIAIRVRAMVGAQPGAQGACAVESRE